MAVSMKWPASCRVISQQYGNKSPRYVRGYHTGIDIACIAGSPIYAALDGVVSFAGFNGPYGNEVRLQHNESVVTSYHHMSKIAVSKGQYVSAGSVIGFVGSTGLSTGPHLHFEVRVNGKDVDPNPYLSGAKTVDSTGFVNPAGIMEIPGAIVDAAKWLTDTANWIRVGMVLGGSILLLLALFGMRRIISVGKVAVNKAGKVVKS